MNQVGKFDNINNKSMNETTNIDILTQDKQHAIDWLTSKGFAFVCVSIEFDKLPWWASKRPVTRFTYMGTTNDYIEWLDYAQKKK